MASGYRPTPTIIEAARALYDQHTVVDITKSGADALNLGTTTRTLEHIIDHAKTTQTKAICFVTGVPGAGKTLAGLNIATRRAQAHADEHAVFLSGNGALVDVLREALTRDEIRRCGTARKDVRRRVGSFIQNIHHFRDEALRSEAPTIERVVVFDEAQRAWTRDQASKFMRTKRGQLDFSMSEPEFLISVMARGPQWCVVICLVGGGQEINTGEAGLGEWLDALSSRHAEWRIYASPQIQGEDYAGISQNMIQSSLPIEVHPELHLSVSMRSFRAEALSDFVGHLVNGRTSAAAETYEAIREQYPIVLTRDLAAARAWLREKARGTERFGILASSGGARLRPEGIHMKAKIEPEHWFLDACEDVRSSFACEEAASEFDVQGLELDWGCVCWDADFRYQAGGWSYFDFKGGKWQKVNKIESQRYLRNAYRVILTRARQGMVIFVPRGDDRDPTRPQSFYEQTYFYLQECGLQHLTDWV